MGAEGDTIKEVQHERDSLKRSTRTNSATVFWETAPTQMHSKTFRNVKSLEDWFVFVEHAASVTIANYLRRVD